MYIKLCMYTYIKYLNLYYTPGCFSLGSYNQQMLISRINSIISVQKHFLEASPWIWSTFQPIKRTIWSCPVLPKQLVICRFLRFHRRRHLVVSTCCFTWTGTGWIEFPTEWNLCKRARARGGGAWAWLAHGLQCLCDGRACCPVRLLFLEVSAAPITVVVSTRCSCVLVRVGLKFSLNENSI